MERKWLAITFPCEYWLEGTEWVFDAMCHNIRYHYHHHIDKGNATSTYGHYHSTLILTTSMLNGFFGNLLYGLVSTFKYDILGSTILRHCPHSCAMAIHHSLWLVIIKAWSRRTYLTYSLHMASQKPISASGAVLPVGITPMLINNSFSSTCYYMGQ